jgi:hypothetical protein
MLDRRGFLLGGLGLATRREGNVAPSPLPSSGAISLDPARWQIGPIINGQSYSPGMPSQPTADGTGWSFTFPARDGVHYVTTPLSGSLVGRTTVQARFAIAGTGRLVPTRGPRPARVRLFLQRRGDTWAADYEFYRWWSVPSVELVVPEEHELKAALVPVQWLSVLGKRGDHPLAAGQFAAAIADLQAVGQTFGGMFAGHGVFVVDGTSRFTLMSYEIV